MNNNGNFNGQGMNIIPTDKTIGLIYGNNRMEKPSTESDYGNAGIKAPSCLIMMDDGDCGHVSGQWSGMSATFAWMRWQLGGEDKSKADFVGFS